MTLHGIYPQDIVLCDVRGERFHATVADSPMNGDVQVVPLHKGHGKARVVTARQVVGHWRRRRGGQG